MQYCGCRCWPPVSIPDPHRPVSKLSVEKKSECSLAMLHSHARNDCGGRLFLAETARKKRLRLSANSSKRSSRNKDEMCLWNSLIRAKQKMERRLMENNDPPDRDHIHSASSSPMPMISRWVHYLVRMIRTITNGWGISSHGPTCYTPHSVLQLYKAGKSLTWQIYHVFPDAKLINFSIFALVNYLQTRRLEEQEISRDILSHTPRNRHYFLQRATSEPKHKNYPSRSKSM